MCITIQTLATFLGSQPLLFKNFRPFPAPQGVRQLDQIPLGPSSPNRVDHWKNPFKPSGGCLPSKNPKTKWWSSLCFVQPHVERVCLDLMPFYLRWNHCLRAYFKKNLRGPGCLGFYALVLTLLQLASIHQTLIIDTCRNASLQATHQKSPS